MAQLTSRAADPAKIDYLQAHGEWFRAGDDVLILSKWADATSLV